MTDRQSSAPPPSRLPDFLVVGAQKSATTSLHHYLTLHPEIFLPQIKETKFFVDEQRYAQGIGHYLDHFTGVGDQQRLGEIDPDYMYFSEAVSRIRHHFADAPPKIVFLLRDPVKRAFSHYLMTYRRGFEPLSFEQAIEAESARLQRGGFFERMHYSYLDRGFYARQIDCYLDAFGPEQIQVLFTENLNRSPRETLAELCRFIGVSEQIELPNSGEKFHEAQIPRNLWLLRRIKQADTLEKRLLRKLIPVEGLRHRWRAALLAANEKPNDDEIRLSAQTERWLRDHYRDANQTLETLLGKPTGWPA